MATMKELRERKGWTQAELSTHANVSYPTISRAENGHRVSKMSVKRISQALGVEVEQLEGVNVIKP